ncbi:MAG: hypothetical protein KBA61_02180 [Spirochaetes bacterium]|nr:hypothetical protein [Spirochaetota bacterium]
MKTAQRALFYITSIPLLFAICVSLCCKKAPTEFLSASRVNGVDIYDSPEKKTVIAKLQCAEKVGVFSKKSIGGASWAEVQWNDKRGWVLESELAAGDVAAKCAGAEVEGEAVVPEPVVEKAKVEDAAKAYYDAYFRKLTEEINKNSPNPITDIDEHMRTLWEKRGDIRVKARMGDFAVVTHKVGDQGGNYDNDADSLWQKWGVGWRQLFSCYIHAINNEADVVTGGRIYLANLNKDEYPDAILGLHYSDSDGFFVRVLMTKKDKSAVITQKRFAIPSEPPREGSESFKLGRCGDTLIQSSFNRENAFTFDCERNMLVPVK